MKINIYKRKQKKNYRKFEMVKERAENTFQKNGN